MSNFHDVQNDVFHGHLICKVILVFELTHLVLITAKRLGEKMSDINRAFIILNHKILGLSTAHNHQRISCRCKLTSACNIYLRMHVLFFFCHLFSFIYFFISSYLLSFVFSQGFVDRETTLIGSLTVREFLYYSALLQLPGFFFQKRSVVEDAILSMSLGDYANKLIGGHCYMKGLPTGERRRVSIARELVMRPHVLFIDEPLYHLDRFLFTPKPIFRF